MPSAANGDCVLDVDFAGHVSTLDNRFAGCHDRHDCGSDAFLLPSAVRINIDLYSMALGGFDICQFLLSKFKRLNLFTLC